MDEPTEAPLAEEASVQATSEVGGGFLTVFGRQLKACRERVGMDRRELGTHAGYSASTIAAFEQGRRIPPPAFIDSSDELLAAAGVLKAGKEEVARLEAEAVQLHVYDSLVVNGLLQTEEYARAVFEMRRPLLSSDTVSQRIAARIARQAIFERTPMPTLSFVMEESVVRRPIGGPATWRGQLERILLCGAQRNVEIQVMPTCRGEHAALGGPFTLMETREGRSLAYVEVHQGSRLHTERQVVRELEEQYGLLRAQALTPNESMSFVERLLAES